MPDTQQEHIERACEQVENRRRLLADAVSEAETARRQRDLNEAEVRLAAMLKEFGG